MCPSRRQYLSQYRWSSCPGAQSSNIHTRIHRLRTARLVQALLTSTGVCTESERLLLPQKKPLYLRAPEVNEFAILDSLSVAGFQLRLLHEAELYRVSASSQILCVLVESSRGHSPRQVSHSAIIVLSKPARQTTKSLSSRHHTQSTRYRSIAIC